MPHPHDRRRAGGVLGLLLVVGALAATPATSGSAAGPPSADPVPAAGDGPASRPATEATVLRVPDSTPTLVGGSAADRALAVSRSLFAHAPVVVLARADQAGAAGTAGGVAVALGAPVLLVTAEPDRPVRAEAGRLGARGQVVVGDAAPLVGLPSVRVPVGADADALAQATGPGAGGVGAPAPVARDPLGRVPSWSGTLPATRPGRPVPGLLVLSTGVAEDEASVATARAAGATVLTVPDGDPRACPAVVRAVAQSRAIHVLALGDAFGPADVLEARVRTAVTGVELPGGGQRVFGGAACTPGVRYVALYGTPGDGGALGILGEQDVPATIARARATAAQYQALTTATVVPTLEIIATIASAVPGPDGSYSRARDVAELRPLVEAGGAAGMAVVLDLQPGRSDFLTQAQRYADLLALPWVGLALDPEWRLGTDQVHLQQIGSVGVEEVNAVEAWLAGFVRDRALPQKMVVLHEFSPRMIVDRAGLDVSLDELAVLVHVDGQGSQAAKAGTWARIRQDAPPGVHWGWKNFLDEDLPVLDPAQTYQVQPVPDLVTYQ